MFTGSRLRAGLASLFFGIVAVLPVAAAAQEWPSRAVRMVVHFPAGGISDVGARSLGDGLAEIFGQPFVIDNRPGAGGRIGTEIAVRSRPDGYTLLFATNGPLSFAPVTHPSLSYDPVKDLVPVIHVASYSLQVVVNNNVPIHSIEELIAYAKKNPGKLNYATPGQGSGIHFAVEMFKSMAGIDMTHVPYRGSAQLMTDLIAGNVDITFDGAARPHIDSGRLRLIATTDLKRDPRFPNTPTVDESGVKGYKFVASQLLLAPAGTPPEVIAKLNAAANKVLQTEKARARLAEIGLTATGGAGDEITRLIVEGIKQNRKIAAGANLVFE